MTFSEDKWQVQHLGSKSRLEQYRLEIDRLANSFAVKNLKSFGGQQLNMSQHCALVAKEATNSILGCITRNVANRSNGGIVSFYLELVRPHIIYYA